MKPIRLLIMLGTHRAAYGVTIGDCPLWWGTVQMTSVLDGAWWGMGGPTRSAPKPLVDPESYDADDYDGSQEDAE